MSDHMPLFQKIFRDADKAAGISRVESLLHPVQDSTEIDEQFTGEINKDESNISLIKNEIKRIIIDEKSNAQKDEILGKYSVFKKHSLEKIRSSLSKISKELLLDMDIDQEIGDIFEDSSSQQEMDIDTNVLDEAKLPTSLFMDFEIAPIRCFESEYVDVDDVTDPLEGLIPNQMTEGAEVSSDSENGTISVSRTRAHNLLAPSGSLGQDIIKSAPSNHMEMESVPVEKNKSHAVGHENEPIPDDFNAVYDKKEEERRRMLEKAKRISKVKAGELVAKSILDHIQSTDRHKKSASRITISALNHNPVALEHRNTRPDLTEFELKFFHRPRMMKDFDLPWRIQVGSRSRFSSSDTRSLSLTSRKSKFVLMEYVEEHPPIILNHGMTSALINYYRVPKLEEEEMERKKARDESNKLVQRVLSSGTNCRLPSHVMRLLRLRNENKSYDHNVDIPRLSLGETQVLGTDEPSPFLGNIDHEEIQQAFVNNLFQTPIFRHKPLSSDFLLVRTKKDNGVIHYVVKEIPYLFLSGQLEPLKIVPRPGPKLSPSRANFFLLETIRYFKSLGSDSSRQSGRSLSISMRPGGASQRGVALNDLRHHLLKYSLKDKHTYKKAHEAELLELIYTVAEVDRHMNTGKLHLKNFFESYTDKDVANDMERKYSENELVRSFTPEEVCLQETSQAAEFRLSRLNVRDIDLSKVQYWIVTMQKVLAHKRKRADQLTVLFEQNLNAEKRFAKRKGTDPRAHLDAQKWRDQCIQLHEVLMKDISRLEKKLQVARFIKRHLVFAPWNTTEAYVKTHLDHDHKGWMNVQGTGDPSGRGEGFAYVRISDPDNASSRVQRGPRYANSSRDLRLIKTQTLHSYMEALGATKADLKILERWDMVEIVKANITQLNKNGLALELSKYARNDFTYEYSLKLEFYRKCQEVWDRQKRALMQAAPPLDREAASSKALVTIDQKGNVSSSEAKREESSSEDPKEEPTKVSLQVKEEDGLKEAVNSSLESLKNAEDEEDQQQDVTQLMTQAKTEDIVEIEKEHEEKEEEEEEDDDDDDDDDLLMDLEKTIASRPVPHSQSQSQSISFGSGGSSSNNGSSASIPISMPADEFKEEPLSNSQDDKEERLGGAMEVVQSSWRDSFIRPRRVVKRVTKRIYADGREDIEVSFVLSNSEVERVQNEFLKKKQARHARREGIDVLGPEPSVSSKLNLNLMDTRQPLRISLNPKRAAAASAAANISQKTSSQSEAEDSEEDQRMEDKEERYLLDSYGKSIKKRRANRHKAYFNTRLPRVSLAARLEHDLMDIWGKAELFQYPVDEARVPGYYQVVSDPICLQDIRSKIVRYKYETAEEMLDDLRKMVRNSELFNGAQHPITKSALSLVDQVRMALYFEREHHNIHEDPIYQLEEAIRKKSSSKKQQFF